MNTAHNRHTKSIRNVLLLGMAAALLLPSCKKDDGVHQYTSIYDAVHSLAPQATVIDMDASLGGTFTAGRCRIIVPPNALLTHSGAAVTGPVKLVVTDILRKSEMLFSNVLPVSNGEPLVSGGQLSIFAFTDPESLGTELRLKPGMQVQVRVPLFDRDATGMTLFMGQQMDSTGVNWTENKVGQGTVVVGPDTVTIITDSLGWVNADRFLGNPNYKTFTVNIQGVSIGADQQIRTYAVYDQYNGAWSLFTRNGNRYSESHVPNIPVHFVSFVVVDGKFYGGITGATPADNASYTINMQETSPQAFKAQVDAL